MKIRAGITTGPRTIDTDSTLTGIHDGEVQIAAGVRLVVTGVVDGTITVEAGASLEVLGVVDGDIVNRGGEVRIQGVHDGTERAEASGS